MKNIKNDRSTIVIQSINQKNSSIDPSLKEYKLKAMAESSFTFYRATAYLYFEDFSNGSLKIPKHWLSDSYISWIQGDFHLQNAGFFGTEDNLIYHLNDFDESYRSYFYLDLIRLMTSVYLLDNYLHEKITQSQLQKMTEIFVASYQKEVNNPTSNLPKLPKILSKLKKKLLKKKSNKSLLSKWTKVENNQRYFDLSLKKLDEVPSTKKEILLKLLQDKYPIKDIAFRLFSGLGSLGVEKYYFLTHGENNNIDTDQIYELKEQVLSNLVQTKSQEEAYHFEFIAHANRTQIAANFLLPIDANYDIISNHEISYGIKKISPFKKGIETFKSRNELQDYLSYLGTILAQSHLKSTKVDPSLNHELFKHSLIEFFQNKQNVKNLIEIAAWYAKRVQEDYTIYKHNLMYN